MRLGKLMMIALIVSLMLTAAGCSKTYFFDFTEEEDLIREDGTWSSVCNLFVLSSEGLFMAPDWVSAPHVYSGDLTATVRFDLNTDHDNFVSYFEIYLSTTNVFLNSEGFAGISFSNVGIDTSTFIIFHGNKDQGGTAYQGPQTPIPALNTVGLNTLVIEQKSGVFTFWLNGAFLATFNPSRYDTDLYCLTIGSSQDSQNDCLFFRDVKIEYKGTRELVP